jgi:low affinity Fe/Cu permease
LAKKSPESNGHSRLEDAIATLIQNQAAFLSRASETDRLHLEFERRHFEFERSMDDRVSRIESQMKEVVRILSEHNRTIERLTDAIREKIGFEPQS